MKRNGLKSLVLVAMGIVSLSACSGDEAYDDASMFSQEVNDQKAQIMALAEKYDVEVRFEDGGVHRTIRSSDCVDSVESICKSIVAMRGSYSFSLSESGKSVFTLPQSKTKGFARLKSSNNENPSHKEMEISFLNGYWIMVELSYNDGRVSVSAYETASGRSLTVNMVSGGMMGNGDFIGNYEILLNSPNAVGTYVLHMSVNAHNGVIVATTY